MCIKSELHLNQDGVTTGEGTATLPVKDFFQQIITEARPSVFLTIGTAGSVFEDFTLGDVVITRAAKFRLHNEFRNEPFNHQSYRSDWALPTHHLQDAATLMKPLTADLAEPPFGPPHPGFVFTGPLIEAPPNDPDIKLELGARDMPEFHPILTTDYFEYGTTTNRLDREDAAVEMGDAALGLACTELDDPPRWAVIRNMWRASHIPDSGPNRVRPGMEGEECQNGAGSTRPNSRPKRRRWWSSLDVRSLRSPGKSM